MTKERKLAIEMWQAMREKVSKGQIEDALNMLKAKQMWLEAHGIDWYCECWFCHYFRKAREDGYDDEEEEYEDESTEYPGKTAKCPLNRYRPSRCDGQCTQYVIACKEKYPMEQRLAAVDNIIKALKGEYKE